uniref:Uncharacterized protein n=1 Tax=Catharus ustulatus TaxID=91951 RepID=A0A8C3Y2E4_CATUS
MISQLFILSSKGDPLIHRDCIPSEIAQNSPKSPQNTPKSPQNTPKSPPNLFRTL